MNKKKERDFDVKTKNIHLVFLGCLGFQRRYVSLFPFYQQMILISAGALSSDLCKFFLWTLESFSAACECEISNTV